MKRDYAKVDKERAENSKSRGVVVALTSILVFVAVSYPERCISSMASYPAYQTSKLHDLTNLAFQVSLQRAQKRVQSQQRG
ncbi:hypothetical protein SUGI_0647970 [Cryptomeria japonica]|nr:hypothetical protein SUGI_0647970 [Cryptomeria japonica]